MQYTGRNACFRNPVWVRPYIIQLVTVFNAKFYDIFLFNNSIRNATKKPSIDKTTG